MIAITATAVALACLGTPQEPKTAIMQLPPAYEITDAMLVDVDGDLLTDLVLACRNPTTGKRSLRTHLRQAKGPAFTSATSTPPYEVERDAVAFTFCDCQATKGSELILLTPERFVAAGPGKDGAPTLVELAQHALLWPSADPDEVVPLPLAPIDMDGDGRMDLLLPRPDGWSVCYQDQENGAATFTRRSYVNLPRWQNNLTRSGGGGGIAADSNSFELRFGGGKDKAESGPLVRAATRTPKCQVLDLDGNGKLDLVMQRNGSMHAAMQQANGQFNLTVQPLPLPENRLKLIDPAFDVQWSDINGDGRADLLLTTSAQRDDDVEARVDLFLADATGAWPDKPSGRLRMQALANHPQLVDADGDGDHDLVCVTLRTSAMAKLSNPGGAFEAQLSIYGNSGKQFDTPSMLSVPLPLDTNKNLQKPFLLVRPGRRGRAGDVLLLIDGHLERRFLNLKDQQLQLAAADARVKVPEDARILVVDEFGDDVLILTEAEVRHVRFRR